MDPIKAEAAKIWPGVPVIPTMSTGATDGRYLNNVGIWTYGITGMFAVTACPPFGPFFSELQVVRAAVASRHGIATTIFLGCLLLAFFGLTRVVFSVADGRPGVRARANGKRFVETVGLIAPPLLLLGLSVWVGLFTPAPLRDAWTAAVATWSTICQVPWSASAVRLTSVEP